MYIYIYIYDTTTILFIESSSYVSITLYLGLPYGPKKTEFLYKFSINIVPPPNLLESEEQMSFGIGLVGETKLPLRGGGGETKEISMKNIGVKGLSRTE